MLIIYYQVFPSVCQLNEYHYQWLAMQLFIGSWFDVMIWLWSAYLTRVDLRAAFIIRHRGRSFGAIGRSNCHDGRIKKIKRIVGDMAHNFIAYRKIKKRNAR